MTGSEFIVALRLPPSGRRAGLLAEDASALTLYMLGSGTTEVADDSPQGHGPTTCTCAHDDCADCSASLPSDSTVARLALEPCRRQARVSATPPNTPCPEFSADSQTEELLELGPPGSIQYEESTRVRSLVHNIRLRTLQRLASSTSQRGGANRSAEEKQAETVGRDCVICLEEMWLAGSGREPTQAMLPCGHDAGCVDCLEQVVRESKYFGRGACPLCRAWYTYDTDAALGWRRGL